MSKSNDANILCDIINNLIAVALNRESCEIISRLWNFQRNIKKFRQNSLLQIVIVGWTLT